MILKSKLIYIISISILFSSCAVKNSLNKPIDNTFNRGVSQYSYLMKRLNENEYPKTYHKDKDILETSNSEWWCSGFYPGTLIYLGGR